MFRRPNGFALRRLFRRLARIERAHDKGTISTPQRDEQLQNLGDVDHHGGSLGVSPGSFSAAPAYVWYGRQQPARPYQDLSSWRTRLIAVVVLLFIAFVGVNLEGVGPGAPVPSNMLSGAPCPPLAVVLAPHWQASDDPQADADLRCLLAGRTVDPNGLVAGMAVGADGGWRLDPSRELSPGVRDGVGQVVGAAPDVSGEGPVTVGGWLRAAATGR